MNLSIIGLGNIGSALANGLSDKEVFFLFDKNRGKLEKLHQQTIELNEIEPLLKKSDIIFLCVRTDQVNDFLLQYCSLLNGKTIVLFQAGLSLSDIGSKIRKEIFFIRAITNINVASRNGYTVLLRNEFAKEYSSVFDLLKSIGDVREVQTENELESMALLPGCSPAIVALLVHYLEDIAKRYCIDKNSNKEAIFAAISGTIATMRQSANSSLEMAKSVASPEGKVEKAIFEILENQSFKEVLIGFFDEITKH